MCQGVSVSELVIYDYKFVYLQSTSLALFSHKMNLIFNSSPELCDTLKYWELEYLSIPPEYQIEGNEELSQNRHIPIFKRPSLMRSFS